MMLGVVVILEVVAPATTRLRKAAVGLLVHPLTHGLGSRVIQEGKRLGSEVYLPLILENRLLAEAPKGTNPAGLVLQEGGPGVGEGL